MAADGKPGASTFPGPERASQPAGSAGSGPFYVPPPPPGWLRPVVVIAALAIALAVAYDVGRLSRTGGAELEAAAQSRQLYSEAVTITVEVDPGRRDPDFPVDLMPVATTTTPPPPDETTGIGPSSATTSGWGSVEGLLTFRGNPTRSFHGIGPVPTNPEVLWSSEIGCSTSVVGSEAKEWCGTGWTGQPLVFPMEDRWWVAVGGYNRSINFYDPASGGIVYPRFETGDIIKGTATIDPDGYPLLYTGSRDNFLRVVALDGPEPEELWRLSADGDSPTLWNDDWDGSPLIIDDLMIVGGENSRFYVVKLNRAYTLGDRVTVEPKVLFDTAGWDDDLLAALGDRQVSIENSVAVHDQVAYFANSGGLVQGWDLSPLFDAGRYGDTATSGVDPTATPERVFRYWIGDDTDATVVIGDDGDLYVASEFERGLMRATELGQVFRLDPSNPADPLVWSVAANSGLDTGVWATPALWNDLVIIATDDGRVIGLDRASGTTRWTLPFEGPVWSSPVVVDDVLIQGDCTVGVQAFDLIELDGEGRPRLLWSVPLDGCVESTPAVWDGRIFVGTRGGSFYALADVDR